MKPTLRYKLYDSVNELIAPETMRFLTGDAVTYVRCVPMPSGLSGSQVIRVETEGNSHRRFVLKRMSPESDWVMQATNDTLCRSVTIWQQGLLDRLHPSVDHTIIAAAHDKEGWALLMRDASQGIRGMESRSAKEVKFFLDTLATVHATFWQAPELDDPALGLCRPEDLIRGLSAKTARRLPSSTSSAPRMISEGWDLLQEYLDPDVADQLAGLVDDPWPLAEALSNYPFTLVHGDYRNVHLGMLREQPASPATVLDWQLACRGMATIDLAYYVTRPDVLLSPLSTDSAIDYYRQVLTQRLGSGLDDMQWEAMLDLGTLVDILRIAHFRAWFVIHPVNESYKAADLEVLQKYNDQVRRALRWM